MYAWDQRRVGMLLIGGDKTGDDGFYDRIIPIAHALYDDHIETLLRERESDEKRGKGS
jgi:hypothetical protein